MKKALITLLLLTIAVATVFASGSKEAKQETRVQREDKKR